LEGTILLLLDSGSWVGAERLLVSSEKELKDGDRADLSRNRFIKAKSKYTLEVGEWAGFSSISLS
jgi:hypothetical protein